MYKEISQEAAAAVAIHPLTGEILAMANAPAYDPNAFVRGMSNEEWKRLNDNPRKPLLNRFAHGYAPGSTFKPITAAIGLETGASFIRRCCRGRSMSATGSRPSCPKRPARLISRELLQVVEDPQGTGRGVRIAGHRIAAKTGTAELKQKKGELGKENGWYAAFPADDPQLLLVMMVEDVRGRGGSHVLDPMVRRIFTYAFQ